MTNTKVMRWTNVFVFISILIFAFGCVDEKKQNEEIFKKYFELPDNPIVRGGIRDHSDLEIGINAYFLGDYVGAKNALKPLVENDRSINLEAYYFYAHSFLATDDYDMAVQYFEAAQERLIGHIAQPAEWYAALTQIKKGDRKAARKILKSIITKADHKYYDKANQLLKEI